MEEQIGLLNDSKYDDTNDDDFSEEEQEQGWSKKIRNTQHDTRRRHWIKIVFVLILLICILLVLTHKVLISKSSAQTSPTAPNTTSLRPEEDYILSPTWDFNAPPTIREHTWIISDHTLNPDGVYRSMTLINATFPGPLIECNEGDEIVVHIHNHASNATSIHWHGLYQNGTNWMDGTVGVTQCPIAPGHSFTYRFRVSGQSGTYWYHSHASMQASDGLVGPLIIHGRNGGEALQKMEYAQDRVVMLSDHYYDSSSVLLQRYLAPGSENDEPVPQAALINGRGMRRCDDLPGRECDATGRHNAMFNVSPDTKTRLRVINISAFAEFALQIDEHEVFVTEVDGTDVVPMSFHRLNISPAQRYSIILTPPKQEQGNKGSYWIRARMITHCFAYEEPELQEEARAVLSYSSPLSIGYDQTPAPESKDWPEIIDVECRDLNTSLLVPTIPIAAPPIDPDHTLSLRSSFQTREWRLTRGYLNDSSFHINSTAPLLQTLLPSYSSSTTNSTETLHDGFSPLISQEKQLSYQTTSLTSTITILIQNFDDGAHPFHLHGYKFFILAQGHGYPPLPLHEQNFDMTNPLRRDTATVEAYGWLLISFVANNPGVWAFHCHIGWHTEAGLMMVFATGVEGMKDWKVPREVDELCGIEGVEKGMAPGDEVWEGWRGMRMTKSRVS
ncbi:multicopper oxidase [Bipolaris oryzae ATCC 44560]|uniref:Multicopper oxidase n=1 Tax=Bipolaris oryzae ATCC 44560 TaxID=930090 RepID=W6ZJQ0_COCMI|nr:multicopper oxidase [Bipolaris oryzae ATCC 44560]EUC50233.1 multicopper oxidase [Bipolaris oryzae ATCC 44560]